ncbi:MAG: class I SAM-dependent methyltransferase [Gammaproteobacteria bacterium]|nr:class I SAM-dependent methyltransferase [Gammaproteobacteria bacterium]
MLDALPSTTALATASVRALHLHIDDAPPVFDDHIASRLLPAYQRRFIRRLGMLPKPLPSRYRRRYRMLTTMRAQVIVRARYAEDALRSAREAGANRYLVLAAGLDTFALRQAEPAIEVVEIDHPATQRWKRKLLAEHEIKEPAALTFQPMDFERQSLAEVLSAAAAPDFISWLGTTYYLSRQAITSTLTILAERTQPGTQLVLDYWREPPLTDPASPLLWGTRIAVALQQEPMRSFFDPAEIGTLAESCGWQVAENCAPEEQNRRFLDSRNDGLKVPSFAHLLHLIR